MTTTEATCVNNKETISPSAHFIIIVYKSRTLKSTNITKIHPTFLIIALKEYYRKHTLYVAKGYKRMLTGLQ